MKSFKQYILTENSEVIDVASGSLASGLDSVKGLRTAGKLAKLTNPAQSISSDAAGSLFSRITGVGSAVAAAATAPLFINQEAGRGSEIDLRGDPEYQQRLKDLVNQSKREDVARMQTDLNTYPNTRHSGTRGSITSPLQPPASKPVDTSTLNLNNRNRNK